MTISGFHYVCFTCAPARTCPRMFNLCVRTKKVHAAVTSFGMNMTPYLSLLSVVIRKHNLHETRVISDLVWSRNYKCSGLLWHTAEKSKTKQKLADKRQKREQVVSTHTDCETVGIQVCIRYWPDWECDANCMWYCVCMYVRVWFCACLWVLACLTREKTFSGKKKKKKAKHPLQTLLNDWR